MHGCATMDLQACNKLMHNFKQGTHGPIDMHGQPCIFQVSLLTDMHHRVENATLTVQRFNCFAAKWVILHGRANMHGYSCKHLELHS